MQKYAHLVELEKCCQTHIFLQKFAQNFVLIQPRTSLPEICKLTFAKLPILLAFTNRCPAPRPATGRAGAAPTGGRMAGLYPPAAAFPFPLRSSCQFWARLRQNFAFFGCIGADLCKQIRVLQHFSKSTRLSSWNFWNLANLFNWNFANSAGFAKSLLDLHKNCWFFKPIFC